MRKKSGFTLIELLVVISIVGILSTLVLTNLNSARTKTYDAKRRSDVHQIITGIELYFAVNGSYPTASGATRPNSAWANSSDNSWDVLASKLKPYLSDLAKDPEQSNDVTIWGQNGNAYSYINCGKSYMFVYRTKEAKGPDLGAYCGATYYRYGGLGLDTNVKTLGNQY